MTTGARITQKRKELNLSQEALDEKPDVSRQEEFTANIDQYLDLDTASYLPYSENGLLTRLRECFPEECYAKDTAMWNAHGGYIRNLGLMRLCVAEYLP